VLWTIVAIAVSHVGFAQPVEVSDPVVPQASPRLGELSPAPRGPLFVREINPRDNPLADEPDQGRRGTWDRTSVELDPLLGFAVDPTRRTPSPSLAFDGVGNPTGCGGCTPPDIVGDVGPNHYVQMVNATKVAVFAKNGTPLNTPINLGSLWTTGNCTANAGDPIVVYDEAADRWLLSQFASPTHMCLAISQTADPLGAYFTYEFNVGSFPDYFKFGVWPDAYYMSANESSYTAYAFDRTSLLSGAPATAQKFTGLTNFPLPADVDGATQPPAGSPGLFYTFKDNSFHGGNDRVELYAFDVDWATPGNSSFTLVATFPIASYTYTPCGFFQFNCVRQLDTTRRVDSLGEWPMFRFAYRNLGTHEAMVGAFTVGGGLGEVGAAIRWFELRRVGGGAWSLYQEGTYDPGDGHDRFNASIAMDAAGNIALGYSVSSSIMYPSIRYATRLAGDPLGSLGTEAEMRTGGGSQTGSNRWGDYSAMSVDPTDGCTFWYTNEYYATSSSSTWSTRIARFTIPECVGRDIIFEDDFETTDVSRWGARFP
jgi:hypothetical protein